MALVDRAERAAAFDPIEQGTIQDEAVRPAKSIGEHLAVGPSGLDLACARGLSFHRSFVRSEADARRLMIVDGRSHATCKKNRAIIRSGVVTKSRIKIY
jgi:hypothetical protein